VDSTSDPDFRQDIPLSSARNALPSLGVSAGIDSVYLHLPFCFHKCHYCDFFSVVDPAEPDQDRQAAFTDALISEIEYQADQADIRPTTLFAGGGTPTLLRPILWEKIMATLNRAGWLGGATPQSPQEFTVEANPETVTPELMTLLASGGVNRVSIGAQSFDRESLKALERWHDPESVPKAVAACQSAGITNISLDLIFAIPGQTLAMLERDLDALLALEPTHLSTYGLTYEPNTPLTARLRVGRVKRVSEVLEREMFVLILKRLEAAGFEHYEVSNWARRDGESSPNRCQHNLAYWRSANWLGLGPSAASHVDGHRWKNIANLNRYLSDAPKPAVEGHEFLSPKRRLGEHLMLGLRLAEGVLWEWLDQHGDFKKAQRDTIDEMIAIGMLERTSTHLRLTRKGLFVADSVISRLL